MKETNDAESTLASDTFTHQPHDKFFRMMMTNKQVARTFLQVHLPVDLLEIVDLENIELQPRSYINDVGKESAVDVLFKTTIHTETAYLYLLVEHQSTPDKLMPFRLLKYMVNVMASHLDDHGGTILPLIYPIVVYHADKPYTYSRDLRDLINAPPELIDRYFLKPFHLIDLGEIDDEKIKQHAWAGIMEFALKHIYERDALPHIQNIAPFLRQFIRTGGEHCVIVMLQYFMTTGEFKSKKDFIDLINNEISDEVGERIMSLADRIKAEGRQEGMQQGIQQGKQEGRQESALEIAKRLLQENQCINFIQKMTNLSLEQINEIQLTAKH